MEYVCLHVAVLINASTFTRTYVLLCMTLCVQTMLKQSHASVSTIIILYRFYENLIEHNH